ncbi:MAG: DUF4239 domain-containing protein [Rubrobacter sp.]|nr:DUF4239 domain-containing protein [Rubrobacter sp.]
MVTALCVLAALAGLILVQRLMPLAAREPSTVGTGIIYQALYVMYGVTLGFSLFLTWQQFSEAEGTALREASRVEEIYRLVEPFPGPERVQALAKSYAQVVVEEWPLLGRGSESQASPRAEMIADDLRRSISSLEPETSGEEALITEAVVLVAELEELRLTRVLESRRGIPSILCAVLVIGGVITVVCTFFFGIKNPWLHGGSVAALTVVVVLVLYAIYRIEYPYTGDIRVRPEAFELMLQRIERDDSE